MVKHRYLFKQSSGYQPTQQAAERGLFEVRETVITHTDGNTIHLTTKVTARGQEFFLRKFGQEETVREVMK